MNSLSRRPRAAICDFDGTIAESMHVWTDAPRDLIISHGATPPDNLLELIAPMVMEDTMSWIRDSFIPDGDIDALTEELYQTIRRMYAHEVQPKPGALDALRRMKDTGMRLCILSATGSDMVCSALERFGVLDLFEFVACSDDWGGKTHERCFLAAADKLGVRPDEAIVFEDALHAARTAKAAGFMVGGVHDWSSDADWPELRRIADWSAETLGEFEI